LFAGTFWEVQDVLLEDVERIEVIRGPGATVWGANAVNGVINIITKSAKDTKGVYVEAGGGSYERGFTSARYGGQVGEDLSYRVYGKWFDRAPGFSPIGDANDGWNQGRGGFRMDWKAHCRRHHHVPGRLLQRRNGETEMFASLTPPFVDFSAHQMQVAGGNALVNCGECWTISPTGWRKFITTRPIGIGGMRSSRTGGRSTSISSTGFPWESGRK